MERYFRHDLSGVRIHADADAGGSADGIGARAYTVGRHVVLNSSTSSSAVLREPAILAHELAHVLQQRQGGRRADAGHEAEATLAARALTIGAAAPGLTGARPGSIQCADNPPPPTPPALPARRRILIDANVIDQVNRGNVAAARALREECARSDVFVSQQAYNELVNQPAIPRTGTANRMALDELRIQIAPAGPMKERVEAYTGAAQAKPIISEQDLLVAAQGRSANAEVWSFDRVFASNYRDVEARLGVRVAPESYTIPTMAGRQDYRVGRQLLGLPAVEISLLGTVIRGGSGPPEGGGAGAGPGGGGGAPPQPPVGPPAAPPVGPAAPPSRAMATPAEAEAGARPGLRASIGEPAAGPAPIAAPPKVGTAAVAGGLIALDIIEWLAHYFGDKQQNERAEAQFAKIRPGIEAYLAEHPKQGILVVVNYSVPAGNPDSPLTPVALFEYLDYTWGKTEDEARLRWLTTPKIESARVNLRRYRWFPPQKEPEVSEYRTPFPKVALATFAEGKPAVQEVRFEDPWGFDDIFEVDLKLDPGLRPEFFVLQVPERIGYVPIHLAERTAKEGGSLPVVSLDPYVPFYDVSAACIFPANGDALIALGDTRITQGMGIVPAAYPNFDLARWVRPERIKVLKRF